MPVSKDWGVTPEGFYRPTMEAIIAEKNKTAKQIFGEDFDTGEQTPQGKFFRINAAAESKLCEIAEQVYYSIFPSTATGISLDRVCEFANILRGSAAPAVHLIRVYGTEEYVIPAGTLFKNPAGLLFYSSAEAIVSNEEQAEGGEAVYYAEVTVCCTESGTAGNVQNINAADVFDPDLQSVEWQETISYGTDIENDPDLREKFSATVQGLGTNTADAIRAEALRVPGVRGAHILDNNTETDREVGDLTIAAQSYAVVVHSDNTENGQAVAEAVFKKSPLGIVQSGLEEYTVTDSSGTEHTVRFTYVEPVEISVSVTCRTDETFGGAEAVKASIADYLSGLDIGGSVVYTRLYKCVYDVAGVESVTELKVNGGTGDVLLSEIEAPAVGTITVTATETA